MQFGVSEKELDKIFSKIKNIKDYDQVQRALLNDSRNILLFRLQLGLNRNNFSKIFGKSIVTISNLECGNKRIATQEKAKYYADKLVNSTNLPLDIIAIKNNYKNWQLDDLRGRRERAIKYASLGGKISARKLTSEEREIVENN